MLGCLRCLGSLGSGRWCFRLFQGRSLIFCRHEARCGPALPGGGRAAAAQACAGDAGGARGGPGPAGGLPPGGPQQRGVPPGLPNLHGHGAGRGEGTPGAGEGRAPGAAGHPGELHPGREARGAERQLRGLHDAGQGAAGAPQEPDGDAGGAEPGDPEESRLSSFRPFGFSYGPLSVMTPRGDHLNE